ncbi:MAG: DHH family phosphoesterase [Candidatus Woesearchaeota archaeon]
MKSVVFFDDDVDGLCSYLQWFHFYKQVKGVMLKHSPTLNISYLRYVVNCQQVCVFDKPGIDPEFVAQCPVPIVWIDHHPPNQRFDTVETINPVLTGTTPYPTSYWVYLKTDKQYAWLACLGIISDWQWEQEVCAVMQEQYPSLMTQQSAPALLFDAPLGTCVQIMLFNLKGKHEEVKKSLRCLEKIQSPLELLEQSSAPAVFLYKRYKSMKKQYDVLWQQAQCCVSDDPVMLFMYTQANTSFTAWLSNELVYRNPQKLVIIARLSNGEYKCSLRALHVDVRRMLQTALENVQGYGGGHEHACGACVAEHDFERFVGSLRETFIKEC